MWAVVKKKKECGCGCRFGFGMDDIESIEMLLLKAAIWEVKSKDWRKEGSAKNKASAAVIFFKSIQYTIQIQNTQHTYKYCTFYKCVGSKGEKDVYWTVHCTVFNVDYC